MKNDATTGAFFEERDNIDLIVSTPCRGHNNTTVKTARFAIFFRWPERQLEFAAAPI
jgi:hypothetical protein